MLCTTWTGRIRPKPIAPACIDGANSAFRILKTSKMNSRGRSEALAGHELAVCTVGHEEEDGEEDAGGGVTQNCKMECKIPLKPLKPLKPSKSAKPDHFIALQVSHSPTLQCAVQTVQTSLLQAAPHLSKALVDPITAHITLGVLSLPTDESKRAAMLLLQNTVSKMKETDVIKHRRGLTVPIQGIGTFGYKRVSVLYLHIAQGHQYELLQVMARIIREEFARAGFAVEKTEKAFVPHVTIAKLSKMTSRSISSIPPESYEDHINICGGVVDVEEVQLCAMGGRPVGEYYRVLGKALLLDVDN